MLIVAVVAGLAGAHAPGGSAPGGSPAADDAPAPGAGSMVIRDAATGALREPTPEEAAALGQALGRRFAASRRHPAGVRNADGSWTLDVRGRAFAASVVTPVPGGGFAGDCVEDVEAGLPAVEPAAVAR